MVRPTQRSPPMKFIVLSLLTVLVASEAFAQARGPRYNNPGSPRGSVSPTYPSRPVYPQPSRPGTYSQPPIIIHRTPTVRVVGPRYNPPGSSRYVRDIRRTPILWGTSGYSNFTYRCDAFDMIVDSRLFYRFGSSYECNQALADIRNYSDFCDRETLYDMSGMRITDFYTEMECRNALGYYY